MKVSEKKWYKFKRYPHIGVASTDQKATIAYITNPQNIKKHGFFPFIHKIIIQRRYRKKYNQQTGKVENIRVTYTNGKRKVQILRKKHKTKIRDIHYSNHIDSNIYAYYSHILSQKYSDLLKKKGLNEVVTAYRSKESFKVANKKVKRVSNIDFADEVFQFIKENARNNSTLVAITFDIENFFPSLHHGRLKREWCNVLDSTEHKTKLPDDHYNIFKSITKFAYVEEDELFHLFKNRILVESKQTKSKKNHKRVIKPKPIKRKIHLYEKNAIAYCTRKDIHEIRKKGLIRTNKYEIDQNQNPTPTLRTKGICQGSAISATLANIYMLEFDEIVNQKITLLGGIYRRYSDDMIVVCDIKHRNSVIDFFEKAILKLKLKIHPDKTKVFHFSFQNNKLICQQEFQGKLTVNSINRNLDYLGFCFDGQRVYLRESSLAKYYQKMNKGVRRCHFYANKINNGTTGRLFKRRLYKRYSYLGSKRTKKYVRIQGNQYKPTTTKWGNYITYAQKAHKEMGSYSRIDSQIKKHWKNLNIKMRP